MPSVGKKAGGGGLNQGGPKPNLIVPNHAPVLDLNNATSGTSTTVYYHVSDPLTKIAPCASLFDADSPDFQGGSLRVSLTANGTASDQLAIITDATVTLTGTDNSGNRGVKIDGTLIGTLSGGQNRSDLVITLHSTATAERVEILLEHIAYSSSAPSTLPRTVTFTLIDGDGVIDGGSDTATATATITYGASAPINIAPVLTDDLAADVTEGGAYRRTPADLSYNDPEDGAASVTLTISNRTNGTVKVNGVAATSFTGQQLLDGLVTFEHNGSETSAATF